VVARPSVDLFAVASDRLRNGVQAGTLKGITLIDTRNVERDFDAPQSVEVQRREMKLKVSMPAGMAITTMLQRIKPWATGQGFDVMNVEWQPQAATADGGAEARRQPPEHAKINLAQEDIGETLFAKKEFVTLAADMTDLNTDFNDELLAAMVAILP